MLVPLLLRELEMFEEGALRLALFEKWEWPNPPFRSFQPRDCPYSELAEGAA